MRNIKIEAIEDEFYRPVVDFNSETGICEMIGESYLEETSDFYTPLIKWLKEYIRTVNKQIVFNFKLTYYNTSSSKKILEILKILKDYLKSGGDVTINWFYEENDTDIIEDAEDFIIITGLQINLVKYE